MPATAPLPFPRSGKTIDSGVLEDVRAGRLEGLGAEELLRWAIRSFHPRLSLSCSFGNAEGLVLLDMMHRIEPTSRVYVLDTGRMHQATYDLIDRVRDRYDKEIEIDLPGSCRRAGDGAQHGMNLFYESLENRQLCCRLRKVEPQPRYLAELDAYVTGLRRDQGVTRTETARSSSRRDGSIVKMNPLADWTQDQVARYVREHNVPINRLHAEGYPRRWAATLHARRSAGRRSALGPLVVGERGDARVRDPCRRGGEGIWI